MDDDQDFANLMQKYRKRLKWSQTILAERIGVHRNTISSLETRQKRPNQPEVLQLAKAFQLEGEERKKFLIAANVKGNATDEGLWNVPHNPNPFFTGHEEIFPSLWKRLAPSQETRTIADTQALSGLGGIGKTQMAVEYAYRYANKYDAVLWLPADSIETLIAACLQLAVNELGLSEQSDANKQIKAIKEWLQTHQKWLLILDNVEHPQEILSIVVPSRHRGSVLITTRMRHIGPLARVLELPLLSKNEAVLFLLRRTERIALEAMIDTALPHDMLFATNLCVLLDRLPLALDQAGAYIVENGGSLERYIDLYHQCRQELLDRRRAEDLKQITDHPDSVLMTFWLSWEQIQNRNVLAGKVLQFCAFLAPDQIPEALVLGGITPLEAESTRNVQAIDEALGLLHRYSLVERTKQTLSLHRLVQEVIQEVLSEEEQHNWMEQAVVAVNAAFPSGEHGTWSLCESLLPHALTCAKWILALKQERLAGAQLLDATGRYLLERARYREAELFLQNTLSLQEELLGTSHPLATSLNSLAALYYRQGRYGEAEPLLRRALSIDEELLGASHPQTAASLNNLAALYISQSHYREAEPLLRRSLLIAEEQLGASHPQTASSLNNLAQLCERQGRYKEAEPLYQRALSIAEEQLGAFHPQTAASLNNLAELYRLQGRYKEAEPLYQRALLIREKLLGSSHPSIAQSLNNLAVFYYQQRRYEEAEPLYQRALLIREKLLGSSRPDIAANLSNLAALYMSQGHYEKAKPFYQRAVEVSFASLGRNHPQTQRILINYLALLSYLNTNEDMEVLFQLLAQQEQNGKKDGEELPE